jgi:hypothetical protein
METKTAQIRALNDGMRQSLVGGMAVMTPGIAALGQEAVARIIKTIEVYDDFCHANDPHEEHDFGAFEADGKRVFFKIDYYDETLTVHSPDPSDPSVTKRVITIMLAEEGARHYRPARAADTRRRRDRMRRRDFLTSRPSDGFIPFVG